METPVNLLWTSGWDSTFRLLELLVVQQRPVQPYYVIDRTRKSFTVELQTMEKLKKMTFSKFPHARKLLLPTIVQELEDISPNKELTECYTRLAARKRLGAQYEWLARFAKQAGLTNLEMCLETRSPGFFTSYVGPYMVQTPDGPSFTFRLGESPQDPDVQHFKYFTFPITHLTKLDLQDLAQKHGFLDILNQTWFCHSPLGQKPCGTCRPCYTAVEEGMGRRVPLTSRLRCLYFYHFRLPLHRVLRRAKASLSSTSTSPA